jgi:hypothetical protein
MKKAVVFFCLTAAFWLIALVLIFRFVKSIPETANENLAKVEAPGSAIFPIEEVGTITLWHNYQDFHNDKVVNHDASLPSGYGFELREMGSSATVPFSPSRGNLNVSGLKVSKAGVGTFAVPKAGDYELTVTAPIGQERLISLSEGSFAESFGNIFGKMLGAIIAGILGFSTLILAIIFLVTTSKAKRPLPTHVS